MNRTVESPQVIAALVYDDPFFIGEERALHILRSIVSLGTAEGTESDPFTIFIQGPNVFSQTGLAAINMMSYEDIISLIVTTEGMPETDEHITGIDTHVLAIGDVPYCQAVMHFLATRRGGKGMNWGFHFIRLLSPLKNHQMIWMLDDGSAVKRFPQREIGEFMCSVRSQLETT